MTDTDTTAPAPTAVGPDTPTIVSEESATRVFSTSVMISAVRCTLAYVVFPWLLPALGVAGGVGPGIGLAVGVVAIGFNIASIRRFHRSGHRMRWPITGLNLTVIVMLGVLALGDLRELF